MKKAKKIFAITGIVLFVIILLLVLTPVLFKNKLIQIAKDQANENLKAKIEFTDFKLSMFKNFPSLNVRITDLSIEGIDNFEGDTLVSMDYLSVNLNLMSVIKGNNIKVKSIILNKPNILIKYLKDGSANYDIAIEDSTQTVEETDTTSTTDDEFLLTLKKLEIIDGNLIYEDDEYNMLVVFNNLNLLLKGDFTEDITDLDFNFKADEFTYKEDGIAYVNKALFEFDSKVNADLVNYKYIFEENLLTLNEFELAFDGWVSMPYEDIDMDLTFSSKKTDFKSILSLVPAIYQSDFEDVETSGTLAFDGYAKGTLSDTKIPAFGINLLVENARFHYPDLPSSVENINIDCKLTNPGNEDINNIEIKSFHMEMADNPVDIVMYIASTAYDVYLDGQVAAQLNLNDVNTFYPLEDITLSGNLVTDIKIKGNLSAIENETYDNFSADGYLEISNFNTEIEDTPPVSIEHSKIVFNPEFAELESFDAQIGNSDLHLIGRIDNFFQYLFNEQLLTAEFNFNSDLIDLNELLFSEATDTLQIEEETVSDEEVETSAFEIPANIDFTLNSQITKVYYDKLITEDFIGIIKIKDSKVDINQLSMNLLKGSLIITGSYDAADYMNPYADFNLDLTDIDITSTFEAFNTIQKLAPILENCIGKISAEINFSSQLDAYLMPVMNSINGYGSIETDNISIIGNKVFTTLANLTKQEKFSEPALKDINLSFEIIDGNIEIKPTEFMLANTKASLQGTTNLDQSIKYQLGITLPQTVAGGLVENILNINKEIMVFANIVGTITDPKIEKFSSSIVDEVQDEILEGLSEEAKKLIADVEAEAKKLIEEAEAKKQQLVDAAETQAETLKTKAKKESDDLLAKAETEGDALIAKAGNNPIAKKAAEKAAAELLETAQKKADKVLSDANTKIDKTVDDAEKEGDKLVKNAKAEGDKLIKEAKEKAEKL